MGKNGKTSALTIDLNNLEAILEFEILSYIRRKFSRLAWYQDLLRCKVPLEKSIIYGKANDSAVEGAKAPGPRALATTPNPPNGPSLSESDIEKDTHSRNY